MSGKSKTPSKAGPAVPVAPTATKADLEKLGERKLAEQLLNHVYWLYTKPAKVAAVTGQVGFGTEGLEAIAKEVGLSLIHPRKKVSVMVIGNHSAGKSTFMNWYVGEEIQNTGVAVETQGFTIISNGNMPQDFKGEIVMHMNTHLHRVVNKFEPADRKGFMDSLNAIVTRSEARQLKSVELVDTPGLVDGNVNYPFNVNSVIADMAELSDLVLVFLDPIGQALCSRTMNVVEDLNKRGHSDKMRYYLTKADTVRRRDDLNKVIVQITQNLASRVPSTHGFRLPTLWIPLPDGSNVSSAAASSETNSLHELVTEVQKTIQRKVQSNMSLLQDQSKQVIDGISRLLAKESEKRARVSALRVVRYAVLLPLLLAVLLFTAVDVLRMVTGTLMENFDLPVNPLTFVKPLLPLVQLLGVYEEYPHRLGLWAAVVFIMFALFKVYAWRIRRVGALGPAKIKALNRQLTEVSKMQSYGLELNQLYVRAAQNPEYEE